MSDTPSAPVRSQNIFVRIFRNASFLMSGKFGAGVLGLVYLAIAARALGTTDFGVLVVVQAYAMTIAALARFQSWQAVIHFGSKFLEGRDDSGFQKLIVFTTAIDVISAAFAVAVALVAAPFMGRLMGWPEEAMQAVYVYCFVIPFLFAATPTGVLRLFDRYKTLGAQLLVMPLTRVAGALIVWAAGGGLIGFLIVWMASGFLDGMSLWMLGARALARKKNLKSWRVDWRNALRGERGWWPFVIKSNLSGTADLANMDLPVLIVGAMLGPAPAGLVKLAINVTNWLSKPALLIDQSVMPELSRLAVQGKIAEMRSVALKSGFFTGLASSPIVFILIFFSAPIVVLIAGEEFRAAAGVTAIIAGALMIKLFGSALEPGLLSLGRAGRVLTAQALSSLVHVASLWLLLPVFGVEGAGWARMAAMAALVGTLALQLAIITRGGSPKAVKH
ncbi:MAG: lipopolysaccharide biosynthesis protein [Parvularculaceae bacterium]